MCQGRPDYRILPGGNIKRITEALDPRGYEVCPIASPEPHEKARHYLWRFWTRLPKDGHIAIFDRTWYGRVMVERLEGFCSENDWKRAYNEMNEFEKELHDWGAVIIKFWVQIDKDTQFSVAAVFLAFSTASLHIFCFGIISALSPVLPPLYAAL